MPNGKQKLVMVPGTGVVAFPGDMEDEHVAAAIRAFRSQKAADQAAKSHLLNRPQPLTTEESEHARQLKAAQPLSSAIPHLPAWLNTPSTELGRQTGNWLSGEIGKVLGTKLPDIEPGAVGEQEADQFRQAHPIAGGVAHGISDLVNGLTTPANAALMMTAPESKVMSALFGLQAVHGAYKNAEAAREAYREGKNEEATRYATESILGGAMGLTAGAHALKPVRGPQGEILPPEAKPQPESPSLPPPTPVTLEGKTGGFALPEYNEAPIANYQLIYKSPAADPEEMNQAVNDLVQARESKGWSDPNATEEEARAAQRNFYAAADRLGKLRQKSVGQIRQIPSGEKIVYLTRAGLNDLSAGLRGRAPDPEYSLNGVSIAGRYIPIVQSNLAALNTPHNKELTKLLSMGAGPDGTVTISAVPTKDETLSEALSRLREELNHGWQKQFADAMGNHLLPSEFKSLNESIPDAMKSYLLQQGYPEDTGDKEENRMRVLEASAKAMSGAPSEFGMTPDEAANYLWQYFQAVDKAHGPNALEQLVHTTNFARKLKEDYANARNPSRGSRSPGTLPGLPAGGQGRAQESFGAPGRGTAPVTGPPAQAGAATPSLAALRDEAALRRPSPVPSQTANLSYVSADQSQPFYLKSDQIIDQKMKGPMSGPDVLRMLRNNGVKADELEATGLADLLSEDRKFTPEEVKEFAAANPVQIEEITKGSLGPNPMAAEEKAVLDWAEKNYPNDVDDVKRALLRISHGNQRAVGDLEFFGVPDDLLEPFRNYAGGEEGPKYGQYTEPGGENYRELLVTIPSAGKGPAQVAYDNFVRNMQRKYLNKGQWAQKISANEEAERQRLSAAVRNEREGESSFRSPHWPDNPNVLVHIRANDRTLPNGKKVLHVEEIQSDWAQKGRKEGFAPSPKVAQTIPLKAEHKDGYWEVTTGDGRFVTNAYDGEAPTEETAIALARYRLEHEPRRTGFGGAVPAMPFAKTWHELALRRILKYAVDHGYEGVSWTPGEKQAARYDLSKQVNRIAVIPTAGGNRAVRIEPKDGSSIKLMVDKEGTVTPAFSSDDQFAGKNIADVVGKDVADKIMAADKDTNLTGLDLKVGGSGMHGFYDKIVPDYLNKIGKRFGAKVGTAATNVQALAKPVYRYEGPELNPEGIKALYNEIKEGKRPDTELAAGTNFVNRSKLSSTLSYIYGEMIDHGLSYNDAVSKTLANSQPLIENFAKEMGGKAVQKTHQTTKFPFLPITPEMRSAFGEPMALFNQTRRTPEPSPSTISDLMEEAKRRAPGAVATETPEFKRWFGESKVVDENGQPLVMYHGSPKTFAEFKDMPRAAGHIASLGGGHYFTSDRQTAENFMHGKKGPSKTSKLYEVYIAAKSPFSVATADANRLIDAIKKVRAEDGREPLPQRVIDSYARDVEEIKADSAQNVPLHNEFTGLDKLVSLFPKRVLREAGYDAIAFHGNGKTKPFNEIVVFDPKQVKSATENRGTYDPTNPDITMNQTRKRGRTLYHVTYLNRLDDIAQEGLAPGSRGAIGAPALEGHKRGRLFLTSPEGVGFWLNRSEMFAYDSSDHPVKEGYIPIVLRVRAPSATSPDEEGTDSAGHEAVYTEKTIDPGDIEYWGGTSWRKLSGLSVNPDEYEDIYRHNGGGEGIEEGYLNSDSPFNHPDLAEPAKAKKTPATGGDLTMNQVRATKETARPSVQALMAEALRRRPTQPTLSEVTKDIAARALSVVP